MEFLLDEAYEMFHSPSVSGIEFVEDLDNSNVFIAGACTKDFNRQVFVLDG